MNQHKMKPSPQTLGNFTHRPMGTKPVEASLWNFA